MTETAGFSLLGLVIHQKKFVDWATPESELFGLGKLTLSVLQCCDATDSNACNRLYDARFDTIRYDTIRDAILTCAQKPIICVMLSDVKLQYLT